MNMEDTDLDPAGASPSSDAQEHRRTFARNGLRLPYHERIRLKKIAQRRRQRDNELTGKTIRIATLNVGSMTGRGQEVVDFWSGGRSTLSASKRQSGRAARLEGWKMVLSYFTSVKMGREIQWVLF